MSNFPLVCRFFTILGVNFVVGFHHALACTFEEKTGPWWKAFPELQETWELKKITPLAKFGTNEWEFSCDPKLAAGTRLGQHILQNCISKETLFKVEVTSTTIRIYRHEGTQDTIITKGECIQKNRNKKLGSPKEAPREDVQQTTT